MRAPKNPMSIRRLPLASTLLLSVAWSSLAAAQPVTTVTPSLRDTLFTLTGGIAALPAGEAIGLATAMEVANAPFGSSAGGFVFKLDPSTGLRVRTAPTFGPSFAERALTAGEGKVTFGASLSVATYDKLNEFSLKEMRLAATTSRFPLANETGFASLVLSSETLVVTAAVGATDNLDISVAVPFVKVKLDGRSWVVQNATDRVINFNQGTISSSGLGDVAVSAKFRLVRFGEGQPDPGGMAVMLTSRLPTGNRENFRGLGIARVMGSALVSAGRGPFRPHANVGFEWWEKGLSVSRDFSGVNQVTARHQIQYAAGLEIEAGPKVTLLADFLGRHILGGGRVDSESVAVPPLFVGIVDTLQLAVATEKSIREYILAPGLKWNLKGSFVLSWNALVSLQDNGLRDFFTPVVGVDWTF